MFGLALVLLWSGMSLPLLRAAPPKLDQLYPIAVPSGTATEVAAAGKFDPWPPQAWTDAPGISFAPGAKAGQFRVTVGADVPPGPHLVRFYNDKGASAPRFLIVTTEPQGTEKEPNDDFATAPRIERLPITINGRLGKSGDVDSFAVELAAGQTLIAALDAYVLASPVDAVLRLVDSSGIELALNHDNGRNLDPCLAWTAKTAGTYVLQVFGFAHPATADVRFTGSDACVYRLHLSLGPQVRYTLPLGLPREKSARLGLFGWNLGPLAGSEIEVDGTRFPPDARQAVWRHPEFENALTLPLGDGPEWTESELAARTDGPPAAPFAVSGCLEKPGELDRFRFAAQKGDKLVLEIQSASLGFPLDAWLAIENEAGKELVRNDDGPNADPVLEWTAPAGGTYTAVVGSVLQRSGGESRYRLSVRAARPRIEAVIADSGFTIEPGKSITVKATLRRREGFKAKLIATAVNLPDGLTAKPVEAGENAKEFVLQLTANADAPPCGGPFQIQLREEDSDAVHLAVHELIATTLNNGVPQGFRELVIPDTTQLWLTVLAVPPAGLVPQP